MSLNQQAYLNYSFSDTAQFVESFDEAPLWSAAFGLFLLKHIELNPDMVLLDLGSGTGFPLLELAGRLGPKATLYGLDPWENAQKRAGQKLSSYGYSNVKLIRGSATAIPLESNSVQCIVSNLGVNNFQELNLVYSECHRVLSSKGKLVITTNLQGHWQLFYDAFAQVLEDQNLHSLIPALLAHQEHRGNVESISQFIQEAGLHIRRTITDSLPMAFANGTAFFNHHFVKLGWLGSWLDLVPKELHRQVFPAIEERLNLISKQEGALHLQVPMLFLEAEKLA